MHEFDDDPMMKRLHEIRTKHQEITKGLSPKEKARWYNKKAERFLESQGYKLISGEKGYRIVTETTNR
ncbi:MAG: hypothetical protein QME42_04200 [bacterium]|nr:hypothetical protein [bacterium]